MEYLTKLANWIHEEATRARAKGVVVGISGGIDSALVAYLAKKAFPNNSIGILMPINMERKFDLEDGLELAKSINLDYQVINLNSEYQQLEKKLELSSNLTKGNLQARLRMLTLYAIAQEKNYLVLGTDNRSEYMLGYFTKWGDGACDLLPIVHLYKSEVYHYAKLINLPKQIIEKTPSAGFSKDQSDEKDLGFTYDDFEKYEKGKLRDKELVKKIEQQIKKTEHKRNKIKTPQPPERK